MRRKKKQEEIDEYLLEKIQPVGGISFRDEAHILTGTGYQSCIHVYEYPDRVHSNWLSTLMNIPSTIAVVDVKTEDTQEVKRNLNRSMEEQDLRYQMSEHPADKYDAKQKYLEMKQIFEEINRMKEIIKLLHVRIYVSGLTLHDLEKNVKEILSELNTSGFKAAIMLNETERDWQAMFLPYGEQQEALYAMEGQPVSSKTLAGGNPFHFSDLEDPHGSVLGFTLSGGNFLFDIFHADEQRKNYNASVAGLMGSGKSTLLKKLFKDNAMRGNFVRAFDISGEFRELTYEFGGKVLKLDGSEGIVNPLEILKTSENEKNNYSIHITKLITFYKFLKPDVSTEELNKYQEMLDELYRAFGLSPSIQNKEIKITGLPARQYPIFSDFIALLEEEINRQTNNTYNDVEKEIAVYNILLLQKVKDTISSYMGTYGNVFNGYTSVSILDEQVVTFDISDLKEFAANVFQAIVFNMLNLCYNDSTINGYAMKQLYETGKIEFEDIIRFLIIIDEAPRIISTQYLQCLDMLTRFLQEGRKYFIGIILAAQSIRSYYPSSVQDRNKIQAMSSVFELAQYKFTFQQDESVKETIDAVYGRNLTEIQKEKISILERGECFFSISGMNTYHVKIFASEEELKLFRGGV